MATNRNRTPVPASTGTTESAPTNTGASLASASADGTQNDAPAAVDAPQADDITDGAAIDATASPVIEGRVLSAFDDYLPNDVDSWSVDDAEALEKGGFIDTHAKAVAYAKSLIEG